MEALIKLREVEQRVGYKRQTIYNLIERGEFPAPLELHQRGITHRWVSSEVERWISDKIATCPRRYTYKGLRDINNSCAA